MAEKKNVQPSTESIETNPTSWVKDPEISPTGFFSGFEYVAPEYSVLTPQTLFNFSVRSLTVEEEEQLKGSMINPRKISEHINRCLWNAIASKPDTITTFEQFLRKVTMNDRDALVYALYHVTYKDVQNYEVSCTSCGGTYSITVDMTKIFKMDAWTGKEGEINSMEIRTPLPVAKNVTAIVCQPTLIDEQALNNDMIFQSDKNLELGTEMLVVKGFEVSRSDGSVTRITDRENMFRAYRSLKGLDRKHINKTYIDNFGKYKMDLTVISTCTHCSNKNEGPMDIFKQLFRAVM